ncbi:hypothetical protein ACTXT7_007204 [Hymenolepis weldensis]
MSSSDFKGCVPVPVVTAEPLTHHRTPTLTTCPSCGAEVVSNVSYKNGLCVWLSCVGCTAVGRNKNEKSPPNQVKYPPLEPTVLLSWRSLEIPSQSKMEDTRNI